MEMQNIVIGLIVLIVLVVVIGVWYFKSLGNKFSNALNEQKLGRFVDNLQSGKPPFKTFKDLVEKVIPKFIEFKGTDDQLRTEAIPILRDNFRKLSYTEMFTWMAEAQKTITDEDKREKKMLLERLFFEVKNLESDVILDNVKLFLENLLTPTPSINIHPSKRSLITIAEEQLDQTYLAIDGVNYYKRHYMILAKIKNKAASQGSNEAEQKVV